ncbi:ferrous iron transport protein B [Emticicia sp. 21SJ11W-3]|uniref:ferrous iron transport protein B n=1 Tax=Emticicia sp. 21SJ11W-3 TaxID=2916755 RepID=UPI0020A0A27A|nr:ferrous iron transport protein B [Emticicia sp. 21SJ11W-3]UTA69160.1 ferrous iron transport protein B [Emticicia sp. 21SJ11W-3]
MKDKKVVALLGNPNAGKSSLFNQLTGLRQKIGNFPGVTVDKKVGFCRLDSKTDIEILDLPGTYSIYPNSLDEQVVLEVLANPDHPEYPDVAVVVADASNLKRNMLLFEQVSDLGIPTILALNMLDVADEMGISINSGKLSKILGVPVVELNARQGIGIEGLKYTILNQLEVKRIHANLPVFDEKSENIASEVRKKYNVSNKYLALQYAAQSPKMMFLGDEKQKDLQNLVLRYDFNADEFQSAETINRYHDISGTLSQVIDETGEQKETVSEKIDKILLHKIWGYVIFLSILFLIFQSVFSFAEYPMDMIDQGVAGLNEWLKSVLPQSTLVSLLTDGLIAGIGGVVIFIPQIAFLFAFISILEESGYMARVVVLMDKLIRRFGMSGKSVVPLISSLACAVPAIMSARTIGSWKDRLITIMVTPLMSCSARLPIYTILIALVVPDTKVLGIFNLQGIALMGLYLLGFFSALIAGWIMKLILKSKERSYFIMELPTYKMPRWKQVGFMILEKVKTFVFEAGKVIVAISIVLWVLASYGPGDEMTQAEQQVIANNPTVPQEDLASKIASVRLENSYAGHFGKFIEPAIAPLGYDWKIGIALITSFAAREVFVGTVSTIYSIGADPDDESTIKERLRNEINTNTGQPAFSVATSFSLLIFYVFAMMCMSTIATVYRETKGWKWPLIQLGYMSVLAYVAALLVYQVLK